MILFPYIAWLVIAQQWFDALYDKGQKVKSKTIKSIWIASWFLLPKLAEASNWYYLLIPLSYLILRCGVADWVSNEFRGLTWNRPDDMKYLWTKIINGLKRHTTLYIIYIAICILSSFFILNWLK